MTQTAVTGPFNRKLVRHYRARRAKAIGNYDFLINWTAENLIERLDVIKRKFPTVIQLGCRHDPRIDKALIEAAECKTLVNCDLNREIVGRHTGLPVVCDEEAFPFRQAAADMVMSSFNLHSVNDLPGALIQIRRTLKPDGLFLGAFPGGKTLHELRQSLMQAELKVTGGASPRVFPFAEKQQVGALMQRAGFALPVVDSETVTVSYKSLRALLDDIRGMGESNSLAGRPGLPVKKAVWEEAETIYHREFGDGEGRIEASFEIVFVIGWAPHETQQKPLRPGSAKIRLADALETDEKGTGEPAKP